MLGAAMVVGFIIVAGPWTVASAGRMLIMLACAAFIMLYTQREMNTHGTWAFFRYLLVVGLVMTVSFIGCSYLN